MHEFTSELGIQIVVGENAKENDELTQSADASHYWFHIAEFPGAHVVARTATLDRETKRDAAILACHFSKAPLKTAKMLVVDTCRVSDVHKPEKAHHGSVVLSNSEQLTIFYQKIPQKARLGRLLTGQSAREYLMTTP